MILRYSSFCVLLGAALLTIVEATARAAGKSATVEGYVLDSACAFIKDLKKPVSTQCAISCAKAGSPLVILADDGAIYWPISDSVPAKGQNDRLTKFAGERVKASGKVFDRGGSHALVIEHIEAASPTK